MEDQINLQEDETIINNETVEEVVDETTEVEEFAATPEETTEEVSAEAEEPAYEPDYTFKVYDEEKEIDDFFKGLIKDKETEEKVREFMCKAYGLEPMKEKYNALKERVNTEYKPQVEQFTNMQQNINLIGEMANKKDFGSIFDFLKWNRQDILNWAVQEAEYMQMPPEQKALYEQQRQLQNQAYQAQHQNQMYEQQIMQKEVETRTLQLDYELQRPDVSSFAQNYDSKAGKPGAFKEEVIKQGQIAWHVEGKDIPIMEAVQRTMQRFGNFVQTTETPAPVETRPVSVKDKVVTPATKQTLPNIQGKGTSPARPKIRNLDDIKKLYQQKSQE